MHKRLKVKLYPTVKQKQVLDNHFNAYRYCYNLCLEYKSLLWSDYKKNVSGFDMQNELFEIRKETTWLNSCKAECIRDAALNVNKAYSNFFKGNGFPKYKTKRSKQSFHAYQYISCKNSNVKFYGVHIKYRTSEAYKMLLESNKIKQVTFYKDNIGNYYATFLIDVFIENKLPHSVKQIGIDLGLKSLLVTSEGLLFENNKYLKAYDYRLKRLNRKLSKSKSGSKNRDKIISKIGITHAKATNKREHYYHQITNQLLRDNQTIYIEDLSSKNLVKNRKLSKGIMDASWGILVGMLEYKAKWYDRDIIKINRFYPSSKTCSNCGNKKEELKLSERTYNCESCGCSLDRDKNAAINIFKEGQRISGMKIPEVPVEEININ